MKFWTALLVCVLVLASTEADARRIGGGKSLGRQSPNVTQRDAAPAPSQPGAPAQSNAAAARPATPAAAAAAAPARRPWGAMLGGLAAGLGLAWLASSLGLGAAFGNILLIALLAFAVVAVIGMVMRSRRPSGNTGGLAYQGAGGVGSAPTQPASLRQYSPENVGNDASARPWERNSMAFDASSLRAPVAIGSALAGSQGWGVPSDFDADGFLQAAKRNFVTLQEAWDRADIATLRSMMTDGMVDEIRVQLNEREAHLDGQPNKTDVVMIDARLLGIEDLGQDYMASVEYSGMIREQPSAGPSPFREVWNMTKPKSGGTGWLVAGVQALQ
ncbi:MAG: Tim44 domain-containing protein [Rubrivivax sp.]|nr:MAG: Tim44 domain-containing protein [Rubrivivax sp.]